MNTDTISEAQFMLTELRYTLGQIHVQVGDMDEATMRSAHCEGRTVEQILQDMLAEERTYQQKYAQLLGESAPKEQDAVSEHIPLPVNEEDEEPGLQASFEHSRALTISLLERDKDKWSQEVVDAVREQLAKDRANTTTLAECRRQAFETDSRPDLDEPLEAAKEPGKPLADQAPETTTSS